MILKPQANTDMWKPCKRGGRKGNPKEGIAYQLFPPPHQDREGELQIRKDTEAGTKLVVLWNKAERTPER